MGINCLKATATSRRQFTFYHSVPRNSWYSFYRPRKDERLSQPWSHPVILNTAPLDWESSALTTRLLLHKVNSTSNFALFFIVMAHNFSANFKVMPFPLWTKGSHQSPSFVKCSGENLPNFSSLFSNHTSVFLQNLHISSVSWKIIPL